MTWHTILSCLITDLQATPNCTDSIVGHRHCMYPAIPASIKWHHSDKVNDHKREFLTINQIMKI